MEKAAKRAPPVGGRLQHNVYTPWSLLVALYGAADGGAGIRPRYVLTCYIIPRVVATSWWALRTRRGVPSRFGGSVFGGSSVDNFSPGPCACRGKPYVASHTGCSPIFFLPTNLLAKELKSTAFTIARATQIKFDLEGKVTGRKNKNVKTALEYLHSNPRS